ncbi:MAG TPA: ABC transporter ATP-binding protein [Acidimicrobiales bacterium]|jgi:ABC-type branched-subunit amino acid transport system ATPase component
MSRLPSLSRLPALGGLRRSPWRRPPTRDYPPAEHLDEGLDLTGDDEVDVTLATGELPRPAHGADVVLEVLDVTLRFGGLVALDNISLSVHEGEIVGLIGPNGAGKTTLFECISGFYRPDRGHVYYRVPEGAEGAEPGRVLDLLGEPPHRRAWLGIGRTFQSCRMFQNLSVFDALRIAQHRWMTTGPMSAGLGTKRSAADEGRVIDTTTDLCRMMGLQAYENKFCAELSYGTLRLVELAAIMALKPKFLLLDEPSSGISQKETEQLLPLLRDVRTATGSTILIIEHDMPLIMQLSDRIYAMAAGTVIASGAPDEVQADPAVIESYLGTSRYGTVVGSSA